jgi:hypothetical protein
MTSFPLRYRSRCSNTYTVSASLKGQSHDMGRMIAFSPGWLENQSVWLHMPYKYHVELLRKVFYDEFLMEMISGTIWKRPDQYKRSLMECSSFIASSEFNDPSDCGRGYIARLSGSTAEFLSMWVLIGHSFSTKIRHSFSTKIQVHSCASIATMVPWKGYDRNYHTR